ncbi:MAG: DUF1223 domain-containing protein [Alphaproteobacteria bacterium]
MKRRAVLRLTLAPLALGAFAGGMTRLAAREPAVLVELFTSQGCNSCPPADAFLGELARRPGVVALSMHVDYWNHLGWPDPFASPEATQRQRAYAARLGSAYVYTPQMVIDGRAHETGGARAQIEALIERARVERKFDLAPSLDATGRIALALPDEASRGDVLTLALFDAKHTTEIKRGENGGRRLDYYNVVRALRRASVSEVLAPGKARTLVLPVSEFERRERSGAAIILQQGDAGPVRGAAVIRFDGKHANLRPPAA